MNSTDTHSSQRDDHTCFLESALEEDSAAPSQATILIADDEALVLVAIRRLVASFGMRVLEATDGEEAVQVFRRHRSEIDAVILDITMPKLSGPEALEELRRLSPDVKVLFATGYSEQLVFGPQGPRKPFELIMKPFGIKDLRAKLECVLGQPS
jgi:CheY-like chemotaxis protein